MGHQHDPRRPTRKVHHQPAGDEAMINLTYILVAVSCLSTTPLSCTASVIEPQYDSQQSCEAVKLFYVAQALVCVPMLPADLTNPPEKKP